MRDRDTSPERIEKSVWALIVRYNENSKNKTGQKLFKSASGAWRPTARTSRRITANRLDMVSMKNNM